MTTHHRKQDFERQWLNKFSSALKEITGQEFTDRIMADSENLSMETDREEVIHWSRQVVRLLDKTLAEKDRIEIMTRCACQYPSENLERARETYLDTGDIDAVLEILQAQFEDFLEHGLELPPAMRQEVIDRRWGLAGYRDGNRILATKIPKSGYLRQYLEESDPEVRRQYYCHCPRIRKVLTTSETISPTYCYCGAGFYQDIWETILASGWYPVMSAQCLDIQPVDDPFAEKHAFQLAAAACGNGLAPWPAWMSPF